MLLKGFVLVCIVATAYGLHDDLRCYQCSPDNNKDCTDLNDATIADCKPASSSRAELVTDYSCIKLEFENDGKKNVQRMCDKDIYVEGKPNAKSLCDKHKDSLQAFENVNCYQCQKDECNGASVAYFTYANFIVIAAAAIFFKL